MKKALTLYVVLLSLTMGSIYSQKTQVANADKKYEKYAFIDAIQTYERIADKGYKDEKMFQKLGNAYYFNAELEKAEKWYGELFAMNPNQEPEYYYRYSQSLKSVGQYEKADAMMTAFNKRSGNDARAQLFDRNKDYLAQIKANSGRYNIEDAGINSAFSDYGSSLYNNKLIFASSRDTGGVSKKVFKWTNQSFTNLYEAPLEADGKLGKQERFQSSINSKFHESTPVFTNDGKTMYFTRNNYLDGKKGKDSKRITLLKIYKATQKDGKWSDVVALPFNSDQYSVAHPALSPDNKTLYFASDMPGTLGQSDLYKVAINEDGSFGTPVNLGTSINTPGRETFPFISQENELYFASDGRPGLGGLDIFQTKIASGNTFSEVQNVGAPVNDKTDDFGLMIDNKTSTGFFTSNRNGGHGYDDIYKFIQTRKLICEQELKGIVTDLETNVILPATKLSLFNTKYELLGQSISDEKGQYKFEVECGKTYYVRAEKTDYTTKETTIAIPTTTGSTDLPIELEKAECKVTIGGDLAKCFNIKMIYFDLDKSFIRTEAAFELEKIFDVMKQYPTMKIDVRSHTDCRQTAKYNMALSDRRAKSTIAWLVKNGIDPKRLTGRGYGETQLVNDCGCEPTNQSNCTEEQHQANRRSEFIVTAL